MGGRLRARRQPSVAVGRKARRAGTRRGRPARSLLLLGALLIALFAAAVALPQQGRAAGQPRPSPQKLLKQFPLNPPKSAPARSKAPASAGRTAEKPKPGGGSRAWLEFSLIATAAVIAGLVALVVAGRAIARRRRLRVAGEGKRERRWLKRPALVLRELTSEQGSLGRGPAGAGTARRPGRTNGSEVVDNLLVSVDRTRLRRGRTTERRKRAKRPERTGGSERPPAKPVTEPEVDALKEKESDALLNAKLKKVDRDETEILKAKLSGPAQPDDSDAQTLKAKLEGVPAGAGIAADRVPQRRPEQLRAVPAPPPAAAPVSRVEAIRPPAPKTSPTVAGETCRITLWRGYVKSRFHAVMTTAAGDAVIAKSPPFNWWKARTPSADREDVAAAHAALIATLEREGWAPTGTRTSWFGIQLGRGAERRPEWRRLIDTDVRRNSEARGREGQGEQPNRRSV